MKRTTIGVFPDRLKTEMVIKELLASGIKNSDISCIYTNSDGNLKDSQTNKKVESGSAMGAGTGAVIGAIAGLVVANGIIPGLGAVLVAGPLIEILGLTGAVATTAAGVVTGAVAGGILGALVELGVSDEDAKLYQQHLAQGNAIIITRTEILSAKDILNKNGAQEVREYIES